MNNCMKTMVRVEGFEPSPRGSRPPMLPLNTILWFFYYLSGYSDLNWDSMHPKHVFCQVILYPVKSYIKLSTNISHWVIGGAGRNRTYCALKREFYRLRSTHCSSTPSGALSGSWTTRPGSVLVFIPVVTTCSNTELSGLKYRQKLIRCF